VRGERVAVVVVPPGFATGGDVGLGVDPARRADAAFLHGTLAELAVRARLSVDDEAARALAALDLPGVDRFDVAPDGVRPASAYEVSFPSAIVWALLGCVASFAVSLVVERTRGTYLRLRVAPVARAAVLAGKALACALACLAVIALLIAIAALVFGVRVHSLATLALAALCTTAGFVGLMMLFATAGRSEAAVAGTAWGTFLPLAMIGGGMIPLVAMPPWLLSLSQVSPVRWSIIAFEGALWRGAGVAELLVPCGLLVALGALGFTVGAWRFAERE
jgi:ABC-2 type transport system permease protein